MLMRHIFAATLVLVLQAPGGTGLDPLGKIHMPIGLPDAVDHTKTFVEGEGNFSPGFGSCGIYFWVWDSARGRLIAPTQDGMSCERGLGPNGLPVPWTEWSSGEVTVRTEVCQVKRGEGQLAAARVELKNLSAQPQSFVVFAALRPLGAAGGPVGALEVVRGALLMDGHPALIGTPEMTGGVSPLDDTGEFCLRGELPKNQSVTSASGECSGALAHEMKVGAGQTASVGFFCPVLAGRRVGGHKWELTKTGTLVDQTSPNPPDGRLVPDLGLEAYRVGRVEDVFAEAGRYWRQALGQAYLQLPDPRWAAAWPAMLAHSALMLNEGAPDSAVINSGASTRDAVLLANLFQKTGRADLAAQAIDFLLAHPFGSPSQPTADCAAQVLWILGEQWSFAKDAAWLARIQPAAAKLAALINYQSTTPGPHWVAQEGLDFGEGLAPDRRRELKPGASQEANPKDPTNWNVAGLRAAAMLAEAGSKKEDASALIKRGDRSAPDLTTVRNTATGKAGDGTGGQKAGLPHSPALALAHQGLLAGNRDAGWQTVENHLSLDSMQGWFLLHEGTPSSPGSWSRVRSAWPHAPENGAPSTFSTSAMPHARPTAEFFHLLRDALLYEDGDRLVLLAGVPPDWLKQDLSWENLPTHFGHCSLSLRWEKGKSFLRLGGPCQPHGGFLLRLADRDIPLSTAETELPF